MDSFEFLEILVAWTSLCLRFMCCVSVSSKWFVAFWTFHICMVLLMFLMLVMVQKRSWSFYKAHPLAWYGWCYVHSTFVISQIRLGSCFVLAVCRVCTRKNFMRILCYVQFVTSEVLNKSTFALEMFSTVRTQNLFSNVLFVNSISVSFQWSYCHTLIAHFTLSNLYSPHQLNKSWLINLYYVNVCSCASIETQFHRSVWYFITASEILSQRLRFFCSVRDLNPVSRIST